MKNAEYWENRYELLQKSLLNKGDKFYEQLAKIFDNASNEIQKEIQSFYFKFAKNNEISYAEAKKILTTNERKKFQMTLDEYVKKGRTLKYSDKWVKQLEKSQAVYRISRLQALYLQIRHQVEILTSKYEKGLTTVTKSIYEEGYYRGIFEIQKGLEMGKSFALLDTQTVENIVANPWGANDISFSESIWNEKRLELAHYLETKLSQAIIMGKSPKILVEEVAKKFEVAKKDSARLIYTESAFFSAMAIKRSYEETGVKWYKFLATLDEKSCPTCGAIDGKLFELKDYQPGITANPVHPRCRCTTVPYFPEDEDNLSVIGERTARGENGRTYKVPGNITWEEWQRKYVLK